MAIELPPNPRHVADARRFVRSNLGRWHLDSLCAVAELVTSELVSNAVLHARSRVEVRLCREDAAVVIEVADDSVTVPARRHYRADATTGRGLALVDALADGDWGSRPAAGGKVVWARLQCDVPADAVTTPD